MQLLAHPNNFGGRGCGKYAVDALFLGLYRIFYSYSIRAE